MSSILVTGGTGFIGSHTVILLLKKGYKVYVIDSNINSSDSVIKNILKALKNEKVNIKENLKFIKGDLRNLKTIQETFDEALCSGEGINNVIHFAGLKAVGDSIEYPIKYWDNNVSGTINLLKIMDQFKCRNLIFSSSATIYIPETNKLIKENSNIGPINTYGNTKSTIEVMLSDLYKSSPLKWKIACLRYFNPIGAHTSGLIGESPKGRPNNIFPILNLVALRKIKELSIFGNDWNTHDGTCIRDYIHVMDVAEGHVATLDYLSKNNPNIISLNLGTGRGYSVLELIKKFEEVNNVIIPFKFVSRRKGDNEYVVADNKLAINLLDWKPKKSIEDMCIDGWRWSSRNLK